MSPTESAHASVMRSPLPDTPWTLRDGPTSPIIAVSVLQSEATAVADYRRPQRSSVPEGLGDILGREVRRVSKEQRGVDRARTKWLEVVGPVLGPRTSVISYRASILRVRVESSALLQELAGIYKRELISAMASGADPVAVRNIEFELAGGS